MTELSECTFSFLKLLSPDQRANQRWVEWAEVADQLFEEFVYPSLERTKKLKSIYTADEQDLDAIFADKYYYLFESIQESATTKRAALWMQHEIIEAKNRDDSIMLAVASLGLPRESLDLVDLYSNKTVEYSLSSLRPASQIADKTDYFLTSKKGFYLNQAMLEGLGFDPYKAQESVKNVLAENIVPVWMDLFILRKVEAGKENIKIISSANSFKKDLPIAVNKKINYRMYNQVSDTRVVLSVKSYSQFII